MGSASYTALDIANYFLNKSAADEQELISNLKLQKLVYYSQGLHLVLFDQPLFSDSIEAWMYGPVVPDLYHKYKEHGDSGIPADESFDINKIDDKTREFLDEIYEIFGQFSALRLMEISHSDECWKSAKETRGEISHGAMKKSLKKYLKNGKKS